MKPLFILAVLLIVLGVVALTYQGITYTTVEKTIDLGPLQVTAERTHTIPLAPILGVLALGGGAAMLWASKRAT